MRQAPTLAVLAGATAAIVLAALMLLPAWLAPALIAAPGWWCMAAALRRGSRSGAIGYVLWWALCLALTTIAFSILAPERAAGSILNGPAYRDEMFDWIASGTGRESTPARFIPQHLVHAALFCLLTAISGGALSLIMGAALMGYMSFYVGSLVHTCAGSPEQAAAMILAWNPWSIVRVVSFVVLGVVLAEPLLSRWPGRWPDPAGRWRMLLIGLAGLALDIVLKSVLAPLWPPMLKGCLD